MKEEIVPCQEMCELRNLTTYPAFADCCRDANLLIRALCTELGRYGKCAILNPAIGYVLRQEGLHTIMVTADITFQCYHMEAGYHCWNLVSDGACFWHVDFCNNFLFWRWYEENLPADKWAKVKVGEIPEPYVSIDVLDPIWGSLSSYGITISASSLSAEAVFFDGLAAVDKRDRVCALFSAYGFANPYEYPGGVLGIAAATIPS